MFFMDAEDAAAESISRKQEYLIYELFLFCCSVITNHFKLILNTWVRIHSQFVSQIISFGVEHCLLMWNCQVQLSFWDVLLTSKANPASVLLPKRNYSGHKLGMYSECIFEAVWSGWVCILQKCSSKEYEHSTCYFSQHIRPFKRLNLHRFTVGLRIKLSRKTFRLEIIWQFWKLELICFGSVTCCTRVNKSLRVSI